MMTGAINLEEEFDSMKATLERLSKESAKKDAHIERQEEHIAKLQKKLDKGACPSSNKEEVTKMKKSPIKVRHPRTTVGQRKATSRIITHL